MSKRIHVLRGERNALLLKEGTYNSEMKETLLSRMFENEEAANAYELGLRDAQGFTRATIVTERQKNDIENFVESSAEIPVLMLKEEDETVLAVIANEEHTSGQVLCFSLNDGHTGASADYLAKLEPANEHECTSIIQAMRAMGYQVKSFFHKYNSKV